MLVHLKKKSRVLIAPLVSADASDSKNKVVVRAPSAIVSSATDSGSPMRIERHQIIFDPVLNQSLRLVVGAACSVPRSTIYKKAASLELLIIPLVRGHLNIGRLFSEGLLLKA